jgi:hypothetical protein
VITLGRNVDLICVQGGRRARNRAAGRAHASFVWLDGPDGNTIC